MTKGYVSLVLHAHLPFIRHPEHEDHLEERWLFEAITETYLPLLHIYLGLMYDRVPFRMTMSITPPLANMLSDSLLQERYVRHLDNLLDLSEKEMERTRKKEPQIHELAVMYNHIFTSCRKTFVDRYGGNILQGFKEVQDAGHLEIITCGATHGFLPLMQHQPSSVRAQIRTAAGDYERHFGRRPQGIWLPECGYYPGLDKYLAEEGIRFFIVDTHGVEYAVPRPVNGVFAPIYCPSGAAAFARDRDSSKQVWSSKEGYPGDYDYREFYRDVGFDLPFEYIKNHIHPDGIRLNTGMKYYRITGRGDLGNLEIYNRQNALEKAASHAGNFMFNREKQVEWLDGQMDRKPIILAPYDAELFGHWWFEGPEFLDFFIRKTAFDQNTYELTTPRHYLEEYPQNQLAVPAASSWGDKGYYEVWLNGNVDWMYPHLHAAVEKMEELARHPRRGEEIVGRAIRQAGRELLLAQSSDWAFIVTTQTAVDYANQRVHDHMERFNRLYDQIQQGTIDPDFLSDIEAKDNIFPNFDPGAYALTS